MSAARLGIGHLVTANLRHSWRISGSVVLGIATATAVIVGALLVGDSMRGSLRELTLERLGKIEAVVAPGSFFPMGDFVDGPAQAIAMFTGAAMEASDAANTIRRAGMVQVLGIDASFWELDSVGIRPQHLPQGDDIVVNATLARELGVKVGDLVTIRLPIEQAVPPDSPLGRRDMQTEGLPRMKVADIIEDEGLGRFSLSASQASPQNAYVSRETLLEALDRTGQANVLLFDRAVTPDQLRPGLEQMGLEVRRITRTFTPPGDEAEPITVFDYYSLTSERLLLPEPAVNEIAGSLQDGKATPVLTYLANAIEKLDASGEVVASVPYSIITAIDDSPSLPLDYQIPSTDAASSSDTNTGDNVIPLVINQWTAERLEATVGTPLRIAYFEPEVENGKEIERYVDAIVTSIVPITEPSKPYRRRQAAEFDQPPTVYNDPDLTPTVPGVTDQDSISDWDLPFQLTRKIEPIDDEYWNQYRLTPKAFLPLSDGQRLFGSRFGQTTSLRFDPSVAPSVDELRSNLVEQLRPIASQLGWGILPIREQQLAASRGTTPFDALFLSLSSFVILSAVMLIAMLFRLGLTARLREFGTLLAVGWTPRQLAKMVFGEGAVLTGLGVLLGVAGGIAYASFVLWALRSWWVGAVTVPFLRFHWTPTSLILGSILSGLVALVTIGMTIRFLTRRSAQSLLSGREETPLTSIKTNAPRLKSSRPLWRAMAIGLAVLAIVIALVGASLSGQAAAGGFVGAGMLLLLAALTTIYIRLAEPRRMISGADSKAGSKHFTVGVIAARSMSKQPLRSTLTIGLMATASFLIIAITAFRLQPDDSGTGGYDFIAQTSQPLFRDLNDPLVRREWLGPDSDSLQSMTIASLRLRPGQDASCNNLYQAEQPTVLGVPELTARQLAGEPDLPKFTFAAAAKDDAVIGDDTSSQSIAESTPWQLLSRRAKGTEKDAIPVIIDQNTALWSLQMRGGIGETRAFQYGSGEPTYFVVVGLLSNSILQGKLIIGEDNFESLFPNISGYQYFLVGADGAAPEDVPRVLENRLGDVGMDVLDAKQVLAGLLAVQNTYLRTFQSLGALGLLLGTIGLAIAQLRGVLERRGELAIMRAVGFTRRRLASIVLGETVALLIIGVGCGACCAILAVLPYAFMSGIEPPILEPLMMLCGITLFGMIASVFSLRRVMQLPLLQSLRAQ